MHTKLVWISPEAEQIVAYCARVSSDNQTNPEYEKLIKYCVKNGHWSIFEMASMCCEINTTRAITAQIERHKSFSFQELSQRYTTVPGIEWFELRNQGETNRQVGEGINANSEYFQGCITNHVQDGIELYERMIGAGIARECARMVLPMSSSSKIYMAGNIRSWIHWFEVRCTDHAQKEHRDIANEIKENYFIPNLPIISKALGYING